MASTAARKNTRRRRVAARLRDDITKEMGIRIVSGDTHPGDVLSGEIASSEALHVSRTTYREAVRSLEAKGLVTATPKVGTVVSPIEQWHLLDSEVLSWTLEQANPRSFWGLFELFACIAPSAAALAAKRRSPRHLDLMQGAIDRMAVQEASAEVKCRANQDFHTVVLEASANPFLTSFTAAINTALWGVSTLRRKPHMPVTDHTQLFDAILKGDAAAARQQMAKLIMFDLADVPTQG